MIHIKNFFSCLVVAIILSSSSACAMNLLKPYDSLIRPPYNEGDKYHINGMLELGLSTKSFDSDGTIDDPLRIWQPNFNSLAMLKGFKADSNRSQLLNRLDANDDGTRGHLCISGDLDLKAAAALSARWFFHQDWFISAHVPVYSMTLSRFKLFDQTQNNNVADCRVKNLLTNDILANIKSLDNCLDLSCWTRTGLGDITLLLNWFRDFPQEKELLNNARVNWRIGLAVPTGKRRDEDKIFALPFGYDGAFSIPFGFGLDLTYARYVKAGFDVELTQIFGDTRDRRIKTHEDQSEIILLQKALAYKDFGLTQKFNLYLQFHKILKGFSFLTGYQFLKHGKDTLSLCSNQFSDNIANTAEILKEYTMHHMIVNASYDCSDTGWRTRPYFSVYARLPFNGKRVAVNRTVGFVLGFNF